MEKDIIIAALHRLQDIVDTPRRAGSSSHRFSDSDRRLARLAIKKYTNTMEWRSCRPPDPMQAKRQRSQ